jgi:prophage antirepressor-like protein
MTVINESGLYSVILRSDKPEAKAFKRWITHEVLPAIRKTGIYNKTYPPKASSVSEIVQFGRFIRQLMKDQNATPYQIAEVVIEGIRKIGVDFPQQALLPLNSSNFDKVRDDELDMIEFSYTFPNSTYQDYLLYRSMIKNSR